MTDQVKDLLICISSHAEIIVKERQDALTQEAGRLAATVGPLAAAYRLAELAIEMFELATDRTEVADQVWAVEFLARRHGWKPPRDVHNVNGETTK